MRLTDTSRVIRESVPAEVVEIAALVTELGNPSLLMFVLAVVFWLRPSRRRETALVVSYAIAGLAVLLTLETLLSMPRPPEELFRIPQDPDDYGFPSGHAFAAAVVYGGLFSAFVVGRDRSLARNRGQTALAGIGASLLIALVSLSRVVLGVHYLGDVIVGAGLGIAFVLVMEYATAGDPRRGFAIGLVLAIPAVAVTGGTPNAVLALGGSIGGLFGSSRLSVLPDLRSRLEGALLVAIGGSVVGALTALEAVVAAFAPAVVVLYAVVVCWILFAPAIVGRLGSEVLEGATRLSP
ncbi:phosphatase PAP2 family protein [Natronoglomus mannanivorans]|uniref:Phosphatase PAP2 family protein n=1 Tax=Natronoglomus mannanivorans TaxID=2979990 RepID=A0AAP2YUS2_9EURY|nr:phosphatase PAP2 family protein [Halobacteria archaeon AArc-xg1-1]